MSSTARLAATVRRGDWVTELGTPGGPFYEVAPDCDGVALVVFVDPLDHDAGTVDLPLRVSVRVWDET